MKCLEVNPERIDLQLASIATKLVRVWHYNDVTDTWLGYDPADPTLRTLTVLEDGKAYWIMINATCTINYAYSGKTYSYPLIAVLPAVSYLIWGTGVTEPPTDDNNTTPVFDISTMIGPLMMVMMMGMIMPMMSEMSITEKV
jgi:hypothetical protein